jgi:hypothetical protein
MICDLEPAVSDGRVFRLARTPDPWAWPDWSRAEPDGTFGNRWDDPGGTYRVLYASSTVFGALLETLSRFRPDLAVVASLEEIEGEDDLVAAGTVPQEWFGARVIGSAELDGLYADIGAATSLAFLRTQLAARAIHHGMADVDAAAVRLSAPRGFTQEISRLVYECQTTAGAPFAGLRYGSRLDDDTLNWAIVEPGASSLEPLRRLGHEPVRSDHPDVERALRVLGLHVA